MRPPCPFRPGDRSRHVAVSLVAPSRLPEHPVRFNRKLKTPADCRCVPVRVLVVLRSVPAHGARRRFLVGRGTVLGRPTKKKPRFRFREPPLHHRRPLREASPERTLRGGALFCPPFAGLSRSPAIRRIVGERRRRLVPGRKRPFYLLFLRAFRTSANLNYHRIRRMSIS